MGDADVFQFLHGDGHGGTAHAGGHGQNGEALIGAPEGAVFPVKGEFLRVFQLLGDPVHPGGVPGEDGTADAHIL